MKQIRSQIFSLLFTALAVQTASAQMPGMAFKEDCKPALVYKFDGDMKMRTQTKIEDSDTIAMDITALVSNNGKYMGVIMNGLPGMESGGMKMVVDLVDSVAYMLMSMGGKSKGMCMDMNTEALKQKIKEAQKDSSYNFSKYKKTGRTRTILGHVCNEFFYEDANKSQSFWITDEDGDWWQAYNKAWSGANNGVQMPEGFKGMMLGMSLVDKVAKHSTNMEVIELNKSKVAEISTAGFFEK
jgi:hypothetical protein